MTLHLTPLTNTFLGPLSEWRLAQQDHLRDWRLLSVDMQWTWFERLENDPTRYYFGITDETGRPVGVGGYTHIEPVNRSAEISLVCGDRADEAEALVPTIRFGFDRMNLHRIWTECYTLDRLALFTNAGFVVEGILRDAVWRDGRWHDSRILAKIEPLTHTP